MENLKDAHYAQSECNYQASNILLELNDESQTLSPLQHLLDEQNLTEVWIGARIQKAWY